MIFVDSNLPMYLVGGQHPHKHEAQIILEKLTAQKKRLVSDVEVLQEILHRYTALKRKDAIQTTFDIIYAIVDKFFEINEKHLLHAKDLLFAYPNLSARDALHVSVMKSHKIDTILTFDQGFDLVPGITRIPSVQ